MNRFLLIVAWQPLHKVLKLHLNPQKHNNMKTNFTLFILLSLFVFSSCSKENEPGQSTSAFVNQARSDGIDVMPILKNDCSNCHSSGSRLIKITSLEDLELTVRNGSFARQLFEKGADSPCGTINTTDLVLLKSWYSNQKI